MRSLLVWVIALLLGVAGAAVAQESGSTEMNVAGWATLLWIGAFAIVGVIVMAVAALGIRSTNKE